MVSTAIDRLDGLSSSTAIKGPVKAATTANVTLSGEQTIDEVALVTGDRVLVKNQTADWQNGIYVVDTGPWRRAKDFSRTSDVKTGTRVLVAHGTLANTDFAVTTADPIIIDTSPIVFAVVGITYDLGEFAFVDPDHHTLRFGYNNRPYPVYDMDAPLLTGIGTITVGDGVLTSVNNNSTYSTFTGYLAGAFANNLYCVEGYGIRNLENLNDGRYVASYGTDAGLGLLYGRNSLLLGAKAALKKWYIEQSIVAGVSSAYYEGTVANSVIIGVGACEGRETDPDTTSINTVVAIGNYALRYSRTGAIRNIAIGDFAMGGADVEGLSNTAGGCQSLTNLNGGSYNSSWGDSSGGAIVDGNSNSNFGYQSGPSGDYSNTTNLGANASTTGSAQVQLGDSATTTYAYGAVQDRSDKRDKIVEGEVDLDTAKAIVLGATWQRYRVNYRERYKVTRRMVDKKSPPLDLTGDELAAAQAKAEAEYQAELEQAEADYQADLAKAEADRETAARAGKRIHMGVLAQDEHERLSELGIDFAGIQHHARNGGADIWSVGYQAYIPAMGAILQDHERRLAERDAKIDALSAELAELKAMVRGLAEARA